jgi:hypothetical protein
MCLARLATQVAMQRPHLQPPANSRRLIPTAIPPLDIAFFHHGLQRLDEKRGHESV